MTRDRTLLEIATRAAQAALPATFPFPHTWDRARYPLPWLCTRPSEAAVQAQILGQLARLGIRAFPTDAGAKPLRGRAISAMTRGGLSRADAAHALKGRTGTTEGVSDLIGTLPGGRSLYVEVKQPEWLEWHPQRGVATQYRSAGTPTPDQLRFLHEMHDQGALVAVAWSTDDVARLLAPHERICTDCGRRVGDTPTDGGF